MGVFSDKIQDFVDSVTNTTTAMDDDVIEGKTYWKEGVMQSGILPAIDTDSYNVSIAPNKEDIDVVFLKKAYTVPTDVITIPKSIIEEIVRVNQIIFSCTDSLEDIFYLPETDGDFYDQVLLENNYHRISETTNVAFPCSDDFLINTIDGLCKIIVDEEWAEKYPDKIEECFLKDNDTNKYTCIVDGQLIPFYDAIPEWGISTEDNGATWVINSDAVKWIEEASRTASIAVFKWEKGEEYHVIPNRGRVYFPGGIKVIIDEINDSGTVEDFIFRNLAVDSHYTNEEGELVPNENLKPLDENGILLGARIDSGEDFSVVGKVPIVKTLHAYQESSSSKRHVITINSPFIFDFKYSSLVIIDDNGAHVEGGNL